MSSLLRALQDLCRLSPPFICSTLSFWEEQTAGIQRTQRPRISLQNQGDRRLLPATPAQSCVAPVLGDVWAAPCPNTGPEAAGVQLPLRSDATCSVSGNGKFSRSEELMRQRTSVRRRGLCVMPHGPTGRGRLRKSFHDSKNQSRRDFSPKGRKPVFAE